MGSLLEDVNSLGAAINGDFKSTVSLAKKYNPGLKAALDQPSMKAAIDKALRPPAEPPPLPAAPDLTDATIRDAALAERTSALKGKGRRSTFLTGEGVQQAPTRKTLLGG